MKMNTKTKTNTMATVGTEMSKRMGVKAMMMGIMAMMKFIESHLRLGTEILFVSIVHHYAAHILPNNKINIWIRSIVRAIIIRSQDSGFAGINSGSKNSATSKPLALHCQIGSWFDSSSSTTFSSSLASYSSAVSSSSPTTSSLVASSSSSAPLFFPSSKGFDISCWFPSKGVGTVVDTIGLLDGVRLFQWSKGDAPFGLTTIAVIKQPINNYNYCCTDLSLTSTSIETFALPLRVFLWPPRCQPLDKNERLKN
ncbi:hypothetical protein J1N35_000903 [Gossypium stocksii]|uniref:Uncharacterized protein n=1 Tax=Gossypium stocksii TaxID=47602 RepID=A0A9D4AJ40_9ROSI|nr:hypothetical protein J1N35_000903 [Gossypium stocksii]